MSENNNMLDTSTMSIGEYIGYMILFSIPCIGFIAIIAIACTTKKLNLKNFALAYIVLLIIGIVLAVICYAIIGANAMNQ